MHKGVILLIEANTREMALEIVREFMPEYQDNVWDWYQVGGRWSNVLCPKYNEFHKLADEILERGEHGFLTTSEVEKKQDKLIEIWKSLGCTGPNPYSNHYKLPEDGADYDVMPLKECLEKVNEWSFDPDAEFEARMAEAKKRWVDSEKPDKRMYGYSIQCASLVLQQEFCFECNVFNTKMYNYQIPENVDDYYAVMVDMHN